MSRNRHPRSIAEFERDTWLYRPASPGEEYRMEVELAKRQLLSAVDRIKCSQALLARIHAKFPAQVQPTSGTT